MLASRQSIVASMRRDAWVEVDLGAIENNISVIKSLVKPGVKIMAVVKSDAYGHGAIGVAEVLQGSGVDWMGVASVDEACQLRAAGVNLPILILSPCPAWAVPTAIEADLHLTVTSASQIEDIADAAARCQQPAKVHLKVDTGMHRLGVAPAQLPELFNLLANYKQIAVRGFFSHLAKADDAEVTGRQNAVFKQTIEMVKKSKLKIDLFHLASGDATRFFPDTHYDLVRPGLILYGLESRAVSNLVLPAMSVRGRINHIQQIESGESVGYNLTWTAKRPTRIASIPIGYADGVDRRLSNCMSGILHSKEVAQIGLISMDQMLFDITDLPEAQEGDVVTLIGSESSYSAPVSPDAPTLHLADWAQKLDTITYELACRLRARMPRMYTRHPISPAVTQPIDRSGG